MRRCLDDVARCAGPTFVVPECLFACTDAARRSVMVADAMAMRASLRPRTTPMNQWYYAQDDTQQGPVAETEFLALVRAGTIDAGTLVWRVGMDEWQTYGRVPDAPRDATI